MITGLVDDSLTPFIPVQVRGPSGDEAPAQAVVDTGFNGYITLPPQLVAALGLKVRGLDQATLADGSVEEFQLFDGFVQWGNDWRRVDVCAIDAESLAGMALLEGHDLWMRVARGGELTIQPSP